MKKVSRNGTIFKNVMIITIGCIILLFSLDNMFDSFLAFFINTLVILMVGHRMLTRPLKFNEEKILLGSRPYSFDQIENMYNFGFNNYYYWIIRIKDQPLWRRYRFVEIATVGILDFIIALFTKKELLMNEFLDLVKIKSSIPKRRFRDLFESD